MYDRVTHLLIILSSIAVGMMIGLITRKEIEYHGPNARKHINKIYISKKTKKCYKLGIKIVNHPTKNKSWFNL
jgi:hypothetical protein